MVHDPIRHDVPPLPSVDATDRNRLLTILAVLMGIALMLGLPFALKAGAEFFLPLAAAFIVAISLVPLLEWLERRGLPSGLAALAAMLAFAMVMNGALALVIIPATGWFAQLPASIPRIQANLAPLIDFYASLQSFVDRTLQQVATGTSERAQQMAVEAPVSVFDYLASSAPAAAVQIFFALLVVYFFLAGWTRLRRRTINRRGSFDSALHTARVIQNVVDATSRYLATITAINLILGTIVALILWLIGMPSPLMWGGIVVLCNFIPYLGPIVAAILLAFGGLMTFDAIGWAMLPASLFILCHIVEANLVTPFILGQRLTVNPVLILVSLSFWGWVWGIPGALLAVPILLVLQTVLRATGTPDLAGFLFERGAWGGGQSPLPPEKRN
jgi:predicted PurR-regulated permease PerM